MAEENLYLILSPSNLPHSVPLQFWNSRIPLIIHHYFLFTLQALLSDPNHSAFRKEFTWGFWGKGAWWASSLTWHNTELPTWFTGM